MKIIFTGDLFLGGDLSNKDCTNIIFSETFHKADIRIVNLEQPVSDIHEIVTGKSAIIYSDSSAIQRLNQLNITSVNLAQNHIHDKTDKGIIDTIRNLDTGEIGHFGAGENIIAAKEPYWITDIICVCGYCECGSIYTNTQPAGENTPGVNPLIYDTIIEDLNRIPLGKKAILFFHWGREHVWLPPYDDILLAKRLLDDDRVLLIVGMHCHRIQGYIEHHGKRAYMSLGNFLFPNFFMKPQAQIAYPDNIPDTYPITRKYHRVHKLTYKKWHLVNRISLILEYDSQNFKIRHIPIIQDDKSPYVKELHGIGKMAVLSWIYILNLLYRFPEWIYMPLEKLNAFLADKIRVVYIMQFRVREMGIFYCGKVLFLKIIGKRQKNNI